MGGFMAQRRCDNDACVDLGDTVLSWKDERTEVLFEFTLCSDCASWLFEALARGEESDG